MLRSPRVAPTLLALTLAAGATLHAQSLNRAVAGIEQHYNSLSGLRMQFEQSMEYAGRKRMAERGTLYLSRPGKMRWDYSSPAGKVAVSDGEIFRMYSPNSNQVRLVRLDEMTDLRAPLSFLLGRMRLRRMFKNLRIEEVDGQAVLSGEGRSGQDFYSRVEFDYDPGDFSIHGIRIFGRDESVNVYKFSGEQANPRMTADMFEFEAPPGAEVVPLTRNFNDLPFNARER